MEEIDFDKVPAKALNISSRLRLAWFLNPEQSLPSENGFARDYRGLAEQMDFQYNDIKNFQRNEDPTMKILEAWDARPSTTISQLIQFLENMGRHDVVQDLRPQFENDASVYLRNMKRSSEIPLQVPEVTSCHIQKSQFVEDFSILTTGDIITGEPTYYDAYVCYADEDIRFVHDLAKYLESPAVGFKLFIRGRDLLAGHSEYETNIQLIKERCRRMLIILSP
ncbi:Myeloid differentiation primary response protein MyD88, partial [Stegodyphus mimosarum]